MQKLQVVAQFVKHDMKSISGKLFYRSDRKSIRGYNKQNLGSAIQLFPE